jgi:hypothetical protein
MSNQGSLTITVLLVLGLLNSLGSEFLHELTEGVLVVIFDDEVEFVLEFDVGGLVLHEEVCEKLKNGNKMSIKSVFFITINIS